jgi:hypothetical protein
MSTVIAAIPDLQRKIRQCCQLLPTHRANFSARANDARRMIIEIHVSLITGNSDFLAAIVLTITVKVISLYGL